ncbi:integrase [Zobellella denitrificans]|uniref:Integrase n=1 Tax=Zobellella denitrificans TaxID=347534 RepID=A0A291HNC5_9GAMM|nr:DDE-type integrase/transposase/recombinase [Zobellella denitrificans]ATG73653.1 integrase [Zobellella denitrificans]
MSAVIIERLVEVAKAVRSAPHGTKQSIYQRACEELGISMASLHRKLSQCTLRSSRKRRVDAGQTGITRDEMMLLSGVIMESRRANDKRLYSLPDAVEALRANGLIRAERVDRATGELVPMSISAIARALRQHGLHPEQLLAPAPHAEMASLHPNHVWQIDASLCVLYYLKPKQGAANGLHIMDRDKFYKNKPRNLANIMADRVWSYEITDHASGWIYVEYVMGAESGQNLCSVLINAMQERGGADLLHGVPRILYMDPGSANTAAMTISLCDQLGIRVIHHAPGNARATGQVENARNIIECKFEVGLRFRPVADLAELNALAATWRAVFNGQRMHRRHGRTRSEVWMTITAEQLIKAPSVEVCRELAVASPESRVVTAKLRVPFRGDEYDVRHIPGVMVGEKLMITRNPWRDDAAQVVLTDEDGNKTWHQIPRLRKNELGFTEGQAAVWGESYAQHADTVAQKGKAAIEQIMTGTESRAEAEAARKAKTIPLQGEFDPYKPLADADLPEFLPRRGTELELTTPRVQALRLNHVEAARRLRAELGDDWSGDHYAWLVQRHPEGVAEDDLPAIAATLRRQPPAPLRALGGE